MGEGEESLRVGWPLDEASESSPWPADFGSARLWRGMNLLHRVLIVWPSS